MTASHTSPCADPAASQSSSIESLLVEQIDIAIVGGAMAGATLALGLAKLSNAHPHRPLKIALIEAHQADDSHPGFDSRSIAIAHGSIFELTQLGIWQKLQHLGTPIQHIHVSDRGHFGMTELNANALGLNALGQVVELASVGKVLFDELQASKVKLYCPAKLTSLRSDPDGHLISLDNGSQLKCKLLVAADGANSIVRQHVGQVSEQVDFGQTAVVANILTDTPHESWAYERFTDTGPLALLPMSSLSNSNQSRYSLVWAVTPEIATGLIDCDKADFLQQLQQAFGHRVGRFTDVGSRVSYPLTLSYMPRPIFHRCVFIGNAAQTLHPIAGQGFNLGLRDVVGLLNVIEQAFMDDSTTQQNIAASDSAFANSAFTNSAFANRVDVGSAKLIHQYLALREKDRNSTITNIEFLVRGFSNQYWPLVAGRNIGLRLLSWFPPLKRPVANTAMGWR